MRAERDQPSLDARSPNSHSILDVKVLGQLSIRVNGREVRIGTRKAKALVCYLALIEGCNETRERLSGLLWGDKDEGLARQSLRQAFHHLKSAFAPTGFRGFRNDKISLGFDPRSIRVDVLEAVREAQAGRVPQAILESSAPVSEMLAPLADIDDGFRAWLFPMRRALEQRITAPLESALRTGAETPAASERIAQALLKLDASNETAARWLIRAKRDAGDPSGALRVYNDLWNFLQESLDGIEPAPETQKLAVAIKLGPSPEPAVASSPAKPQQSRTLPHGEPAQPRLVLSIGPFAVHAVPEDRHYIVHAFRHELIACLVRFREWSVRDEANGTQQLAAVAQPGASGDPVAGQSHFVVEALASAATTPGDPIKLVLTLRDAETNFYQWSERYSIVPGTWFESQETVVRSLVSKLKGEVSAGRIARIAGRKHYDGLAYDRWLRGQASILSFSPAEWAKAEEVFRKLIDDHPAFAPAYSSLAQLNNGLHIVHPGRLRTVECTREAQAMARRAAGLDPLDSRSHLCLGWAYAMAGRHTQAAEHHRLAVELNEHDPWTLTSAAHGAAYRGESSRAEALARQALCMAPDLTAAHWSYQVPLRFMCGDYEQAVEAAEPAGEMIVSTLAWKAGALARIGNLDAARTEYAHFETQVRKRWVGKDGPTPKRIAHWFLHNFPIQREADWRRLADAIARAGADTQGLRHNSW